MASHIDISAQLNLHTNGSDVILNHQRRWSAFSCLRKRLYAVWPLLFLFILCTDIGRAQSPESSPASVATNSARNRENVLLVLEPIRKKIDLKRFSFRIPAELKKREAVGIDSAIWRYAADNLDLLIDLGIYSAKPSTMSEEPEYREERTRIDGKKATMVFFRSSDPEPNRPYVAAAYFPSIDGAGSKLALYATCASPYQQKIAREIFLSIDFSDNSPLKEYQMQEVNKVKAKITYCTPDVSQRWQLANLTFNSLYSFRVNEKGEVIDVKKLRDDFIGEEAVKACLANWKILGASPKSPFVVRFNWKRGEGWGEQRVSGNGFTEVREH